VRGALIFISGEFPFSYLGKLPDGPDLSDSQMDSKHLSNILKFIRWAPQDLLRGCWKHLNKPNYYPG
jgi:hypothetical protein